jgi:hypothetical protein
MSKGTRAFGFISAVAACCLALFACGARPVANAPAAPVAAASGVQTPPPAPAPLAGQPEAQPASAPAPQESPGFAAALAALRPSATEGALQALSAAPSDAEAYALAALAYAPTDVPAMTLVWGMSYQAMGGGASDAAIASALAKVLNERITATPAEHGKEVNFNLRLAPGQMPARMDAAGAVHAPVAHVFETLFSPAVTGFRPPWTIEQFYDVLSTWVGLVASHGTALDEKLELDGWLVTLAKSGHLEAFCYQLLGPAFPAELKAYNAKNAAEARTYRDYLKVAALRPKHAVMPDELVRIK